MARSAPLAILVSFAFVSVVPVVACMTDYQKGLDDPNYGNPNALANQTQPGPSSDNATDDGDAGGGASAIPECVKTGGQLVDAGACTVSFKDEVLTAFGNAGCHTPGCHGGATPPNLPRIDPGDPALMWAAFAGFKLSNGKPYINPCSTELAESTIACNVNNAPDAGCGTVMPQGVGLPADVVTRIETWVACGAPNN